MFRNLVTICSQSTRLLNPLVPLVEHSNKRFAGHSKWQNIRHIKGAKDAERGALHHKISRQIKVAIQEGGSSDISKNPKLENIVEQAKRISMPTATIQSVIRSCETDKSKCKTHLLELKGPGGCIVLVEVFTPSLHAIRQNISTVMKKHNSKYTDGGGIHLFNEKGIIITEVPVELKSSTGEEIEEKATDVAIEAGAEDVTLIEDHLQFLCGKTNLKQVLGNLEQVFKYVVKSASVEFIPLKVQELSDEERESAARMYDRLESMPEVIRISDNIA